MITIKISEAFGNLLHFRRVDGKIMNRTLILDILSLPEKELLCMGLYLRRRSRLHKDGNLLPGTSVEFL